MNQDELLYRKGTALIESDPSKAIEYLTQSLALSPNSPPAIYNRAVSYARAGRDAEAVADIKHLESVAPEIGRRLRVELALSAVPYSDLGIREFEAGNFKKAKEKFESALAYDPTYADAWVGKGLALKKLGDCDEALACYNKAAEVEADNYYAYLNRAELHHENNRLKDAIADYTKAIELSPESPSPYSARSAVYLDLQDSVEAARDKGKAEELTGKMERSALHS